MHIKSPLLSTLLVVTAAPIHAGIVTLGQDELVETSGAALVQVVNAYPDDIVDSGWLETSDGGVGETESSVGAVVGGGSSGLNGVSLQGSYSAYAKYVGVDSLPQLGVGTDASSTPDTNFKLYAEAHALQSYTYTGSESMEFAIRFDLDGLIRGDYLDYLSAYILVGNEAYDPDDPFGELGPYTAMALPICLPRVMRVRPTFR